MDQFVLFFDLAQVQLLFSRCGAKCFTIKFTWRSWLSADCSHFYLYFFLARFMASFFDGRTIKLFRAPTERPRTKLFRLKKRRDSGNPETIWLDWKFYEIFPSDFQLRASENYFVFDRGRTRTNYDHRRVVLGKTFSLKFSDFSSFLWKFSGKYSSEALIRPMNLARFTITKETKFFNFRN